jgi:serine phosphatase RsbU (regulator of sigma subunit)
MISEGVRGAVQSVLETRVTIWNGPSGRAQAGGDWSAAIELPDDVLALTIGDVSGHGAAVSGTMAAMRAAVYDVIACARVPSKVLARVNDVACAYDGGAIVTSIFAVLDRRRGTLSFANAGHPPPLVMTRASHAFLHHSPADLPLGIFANYRAADYVVAIPSDALVLFYTDGITEHQRDPIAGEAELVEAARTVYERPDVNAARAIARRVFMTNRGDDDAAAIGVRTKPAETKLRHGGNGVSGSSRFRVRR